MKRLLAGSCMAVACSVAVLAGHTPQYDKNKTVRPNAQAEQKAVAKNDKSVTMTGCVSQQGSAFALVNVLRDRIGTTGRTSRETSPIGMMPSGRTATGEANSSKNGDRPMADAGVMGQSPAMNSPSMADMVTSYRLIPMGGLGLKEHVGHKVRVTGMVVPRGQGAVETRFNVTKVEMLSATCDAIAPTTGELSPEATDDPAMYEKAEPPPPSAKPPLSPPPPPSSPEEEATPPSPGH